MKNRKYLNFIPIILVLIIVSFFLLRAQNEINHFNENKINLKIIRVYNYYDKSLQFYYDENYCITTTDTKGDTLRIGDSISKIKNGTKFKVFRKNKYGKYTFYNDYEISGIWLLTNQTWKDGNLKVGTLQQKSKIEVRIGKIKII